jgi:hypothetical protein
MVPTQAERIPASAALREGKEIRNCQSILVKPLAAKFKSKIANTPSVPIVKSKPILPNHRSIDFRLEALASCFRKF